MIPRVTNLFWAPFVDKFVAKIFEKSPNLVTLVLVSQPPSPPGCSG